MNEQPKSVLVYVGLDRVGDSLLKLPFVQGLRNAFPDAHITWLAGKDTSVYASVMAPTVDGLLDDVIDEAGIGLRLKELLYRPLGGRYFDLIIDTQRVALATLVVYRIPHKAFISPFGKFALSTHKPPRGMFSKIHAANAGSLEIASGNTVPPVGIDLPIDASILVAAANALPAYRFMLVVPGAGGLPKCWPLENFICAKAQEREGRARIYFGAAEISWQRAIKAAVPNAMFPLQTHGLGKARISSNSPLLCLGLRSPSAMTQEPATCAPSAANR